MRRTFTELKEAYKAISNMKTKYGNHKKTLFHLHTPASYDYTLLNRWNKEGYNKSSEIEIFNLCIDNQIFPKEFCIETYKLENEYLIYNSKKEFLSYLLLANELLINQFEIVVVNDHHTFAGVEKLKLSIRELKKTKYNSDTYPTVFIGIEVSCADRLHVVGIFNDRKSNLEKIEEWLSEHLISEVEGVFLTSYDVMEFFVKCGGITYIAHINSSNIFNKEKFLSGGYKKKLLSSDYAKIIGITDIKQKNRIELLMKDYSNNEVNFVIDNDSHDINSLSDRYFWIKGSKINFRMLKEAFIDFDISVEYEYNSYSKKYIRGIYIQNSDDGFLVGSKKSQTPFCIEFSDSLNAFIGGRGTGKSTTLEFMDYIMGQNCRTEKLLDFLCKHSNAYILYVDRSIEYMIELQTPLKGDDHILRRFGQNQANRHTYNYNYNSEEIKNITLNTYINIFEVKWPEKESPYFKYLSNKRNVLEELYDTRYSVNDLVRAASSEEITDFIFEIMFQKKELVSPDKQIKKRSLSGLKDLTYKFNDMLKERKESVQKIISPFNETQKNILKIIYKQHPMNVDPPIEELLDWKIKEITEKYNIANNSIIDFMLSVFDEIGGIDLLKKSFVYSEDYNIDELKLIEYAEEWTEQHIEDEKNRININNSKEIVRELIEELIKENNYIIWIKYLKKYLLNMEEFSIEFNINSKETDRGISPNFKDIREISLGQKVVAMLDFVLGYGSYINDYRPLIIDQPEDNLDSQYIYKNLVMQLRKTKRERQIILATHSATIVTNSMAECVFVMKSDGNHGWVEKQGYPGEKRIKKSIINYMEGGSNSFKHKATIYDEIINK